MTDERTRAIRTCLDEGLSIDRFERDDRSTEDAATRFFRDLFVQELGFEATTARSGDAPWRDLPVRESSPSTPAEATRLVAEAGDFRALYVELADLTRAAERRFVRWLARAGCAGEWATTGSFLAVFHAPDEDTWHLVTPHEEGTDDLTAGRPLLRRYALGGGETHRTVASALADVGAGGGPMGRRVDRAFGLEPVTEAFYADYRRTLDALGEELRSDGVAPEDADRYARATLHRLLFLCHLQTRGWLDGRTDFLQWFQGRYRGSGDADRFHETWLAALFEGLNRRGGPPDADLPADVADAVAGLPHLGGPFRPSAADECGAFLPDEALESLLRRFLGRYNFTVAEPTPFDVDVAVDPSMLGRVYESHLAARERDGAGVFYTPRAEVDLVCRLTLYEQFRDRVPEGVVGDRRLAEFLLADPAEWEPADEEAETLVAVLRDLRVVDPACGSGAFLVGVQRLLVELYRKLGADPGYDRKRRLLAETLHGVDVQERAVRIAELRLWLSLVAGEADLPDEGPVLPTSVPGLRTGDSLVDAAGDESDRPDDRSPSRAPFEWSVDFAGVMRKGGFDVVVGNPPYVAHQELVPQDLPEGVRQDLRAAGEFDALADAYKADLRAYCDRAWGVEPYRNSDLYLYFFFRGMDVLRPGGTLGYLTSNAWLDVGYGKRLQEFLLREADVSAVVNARRHRGFEEAAVNTAVTVARNAPDAPDDRNPSVRFLELDADYRELVGGETAAALLGVGADSTADDYAEGRYRGERFGVRTRDRVRDVAVDRKALWRLGGGRVSERDGSLSGRYRGNAWGALFHRAPDCFFEVLRGADGEFLAVETDDVETYLNTGGADDFFFLDLADDAETVRGGAGDGEGTVTVRTDAGGTFEVEAEYVVPFLESPKATDSLRITRETPGGHLLALPPSTDRASLEADAVWDYVEWGETQGFDEASGRRRKERWEVLPDQAYGTSRILVGCYMDQPRVFYNPDEVVSHRFFRVDAGDRDAELLAASMNSAVTLLSYELFRNPGLGGGVLAVSTDSIARFVVVDPANAALDRETVRSFLARPQAPVHEEVGLDPTAAAPLSEQVPAPKPDRKAVDDAVFDALGLAAGVRNDVYRSLVALTRGRRTGGDGTG